MVNIQLTSLWGSWLSKTDQWKYYVRWICDCANSTHWSASVERFLQLLAVKTRVSWKSWRFWYKSFTSGTVSLVVCSNRCESRSNSIQHAASTRIAGLSRATGDPLKPVSKNLTWAKAGIWPWLPYLCHIRPTAVHGAEALDHKTSSSLLYFSRA